MKDINSFIEEHNEEAQGIINLYKAIQADPQLEQRLENISNEEEANNIFKQYIGNSSIEKIEQTVRQVAENFTNEASVHKLNDTMLDAVTGGLSFKGFWIRTGLAFKIAGEALLIGCAANPKGASFESRTRMAVDLKTKIENDIDKWKKTT